MPDFLLSGGCHCGAVRYSVHAPAQELCHCHCSICRRIHGAAFASFALVKPQAFVIEQGSDQLSRYDSSPGCRRYFCARCGAHLYSDVESLPDVRFYTIGTLDDGAHPGQPPGTERHICVESKIPWWRITDDLPQSRET